MRTAEITRPADAPDIDEVENLNAAFAADTISDADRNTSPSNRETAALPTNGEPLMLSPGETEGSDYELPDEIVATLAANSETYRARIARQRSREAWVENLQAIDTFTSTETGKARAWSRIKHAASHPKELSKRLTHNMLKGRLINKGGTSALEEMSTVGEELHTEDIANLETTLGNVEQGASHVDTAAGERVVKFALVGGELSNDPATAELQNQAQSLFTQVGEGSLTADQASEALQPIVAEMAALNPDISIDIAANANTFVEAFEAFRAASEHLGDSAAAMDRVHLVLGEVATGSRTEADLNRYEQAVTDSRVLSILQGKAANTAANAFAAAASVGVPGVGMAIGAAVAGGMGYLNKRAQGKIDRENAMRDLGFNEQLDTQDDYTRALIETAYATNGAQELNVAINELFLNEEGALKDLEGDELSFALAFLADVQGRREMGAENGVDLFSYSSQEDAESERRELDSTLASVLEMLNSSDAMDDAEVAEKLTFLHTAIQEKLNLDMEEKDGAFATLNRKESFKAGLKRAAFATGVGAVASYAARSLDIFSSSNTTVESSSESFDSVNEMTVPGTESTIGTPETFDAVINGDTMSLVDTDGNVIIKDVELTETGRPIFTAEHRLAMDQEGISFDQAASETIKGDPEVVMTETQVGREAYMADALDSGDAVVIENQTWQTNGTRVSDGDELRIWHAGENATGIDAEGNVQMTMAAMETVEPGEVMVTMTTAPGENIALTAEVAADGTITIDKDSAAFQLFDTSSGKAEFNGAYFQVQVPDGEGGYHSIATWVGSCEADGFTIDSVEPGPVDVVESITFDQTVETENSTTETEHNWFAADVGAPANTYRMAAATAESGTDLVPATPETPTEEEPVIPGTDLVPVGGDVEPYDRAEAERRRQESEASAANNSESSEDNAESTEDEEVIDLTEESAETTGFDTEPTNESLAQYGEQFSAEAKDKIRGFSNAKDFIDSIKSEITQANLLESKGKRAAFMSRKSTLPFESNLEDGAMLRNKSGNRLTVVTTNSEGKYGLTPEGEEALVKLFAQLTAKASA